MIIKSKKRNGKKYIFKPEVSGALLPYQDLTNSYDEFTEINSSDSRRDFFIKFDKSDLDFLKLAIKKLEN